MRIRIMKRSFRIVLVLVVTFTWALAALAQTSQPGFKAINVSESNSISLTLTGDVRTTYSILATNDIETSFSVIGAVVTDATGVGSFTDVSALTLHPRRFYRAQLLA